MPKREGCLHYEGCNFLRYRLILATISGKSVSITNIRDKDCDVIGLRDYEVNFVKLIHKITNGPIIKLNETGTDLFYQPGSLDGGEFEHECNLDRGISYYLEALMVLGPFCKKPINAKLYGVTNNTLDPSIDRVKTSGIPVLKRFLPGDNEVTVTIKKRGAAPLGGGEVHFRCPIVKQLKTIQFEDIGMIKRIRGTACSIRVSPAIANRLIESAKGVMLKFLPDVYIHSDASKGASSGKSPGFAITLTAETTTGVILSGDACSPVMETKSILCVPEDLGREVAMKLLDEINRSGCVDSPFQNMAALFMALSQKDVCKMVFGPLTQQTIQFLRDLKEFVGVMFKLENLIDEEEETELEQVRLTCVGTGFTNMSRRVL